MMQKNKTIMVVSGLFSACMLVIWLLMLQQPDPSRAWRGLLVSYLFFTSIAAGLVVLPAIVIASYGEWMRPVEAACRPGLLFALPSMAALILLWAGSDSWAPWMGAPEEKRWWLDNTFLFVRNLAAQAVFWGMAFLFAKKSRTPQSRLFAGWLIFTYAITFSLSGFDFVMALEPEWYAMMTGGYYSISGLYLSVAAWILLSYMVAPPDVRVRHDLGKLLMAFCMLTAYLMFSHLFPIWYENLPQETSFLIPRMNLAWKKISYILLAAVYVGPVLLLLSRRSKQNKWLLLLISLMVIFGMWVERWWLVSAVFEREQVLFGWSELIPFLAFLGLMIFLTGLSLEPRSIRFEA